MLLLFSIYFNLLLSYAVGLIPFRYNFRHRQFKRCPPLVPLSTVLILAFAGIQYKTGRLPEHMKIPKVGMQDIIHAVENFVLNGNCVLIAVQQLLFLETYRRLLNEWLENAPSWSRRLQSSRDWFKQVEVFLQLVLLPCTIYLLHVLVYLVLIGWSGVNVLLAALFMVSLVPNTAHVNNFYALLFVQRLTLGEINDQLTSLWATICIRRNAMPAGAPPLRLPGFHRPLQSHLADYQQCAGTVHNILRFYSLPFFYQFTHFYTLSQGNPSPPELEVLGTALIVVYGLGTAQLISNCSGIAEQSEKIKSSVHRLSLIPGQDKYFQRTVETFLLSLNHSMLKIDIAGLFIMDFELLTGLRVDNGWTFRLLISTDQAAVTDDWRWPVGPTSTCRISIVWLRLLR
uniref:Gustatory receptor n=1 Tax=Anopheles farauti TaxID=69004 RepID=A0A182QNJ2_9DIPT